MTTVAAVAKNGAVYMAADSCTNVYERPIVGGATKILRLTPEILLGVSGYAGLIGLYAADLPGALPPPPGEEEDPQPWAHKVATVASQLAVTVGLVENGRLDGSLLLGRAGRVWTLVHATAIPHADGVAAIGSGEGPAIGALDALLARKVNPLAAVREAVQIACSRDRYSEPPIQAETLSAFRPGGQVNAPIHVTINSGPGGGFGATSAAAMVAVERHRRRQAQ